MNRRRGMVAGFVLLTAGCGSQRGSATLTKDSAIRLARQAIAGKVKLQDENGPVTVTEESGHFVVTFVHSNPPGQRGPDYDARVTLDATTGRVLQILTGS